jgi:hypothetical protein
VGFGGEYAESFINHSCDPNAEVAWTGDIAALLAIRNIESGEEITFDYGSVIPPGDKFTFSCNCGAVKCRKIIRADRSRFHRSKLNSKNKIPKPPSTPANWLLANEFQETSCSH